MKIFIPLILLFVSTLNAIAKNDSERTELLRLLNERKQLFEIYTESLEKKSGFFGNTSKKDLRDSQDKLLAVLEADNKIMSSLNRTLDFRNFEKQSMSYDVSGYENRIRNITVLNDTLNKQFLNCKNENKLLHSDVKRYHLYIAALLTILLISAGGWIKKKYF
jgi:hypothetical protein